MSLKSIGEHGFELEGGGGSRKVLGGGFPGGAEGGEIYGPFRGLKKFFGATRPI